jgi:ParB-like chromosome segregation protein Spo0J
LPPTLCSPAARASAQPGFPKNLATSLATGPAATCFFHPLCLGLSKNSAAACAAKPYDACASGKPDCGSGGGVASGRFTSLTADRPHPLRSCRHILEGVILAGLSFPFAPKTEEEAGRPGSLRSPVSWLGMGLIAEELTMTEWCAGDVRFLAVDRLGQRYRRYRLPDPEAEAAMVASLRQYGQQTPLVVCLREETHEVLDGFKRLAAARSLDLKRVATRLLEADERLAKAAILGLNQTGRRTQDWEEAWIVHALVRDDGLTQEEVAALLSRHKSWVCRRLALVEKLADPARNDLQLGLLSVTAARSLVRLPAGNQVNLLATLHRDKLTAAELDGVVDLLQAAPGQVQEEYILEQPRQALRQAHQDSGWAWDPRLSKAGNRVARRLAYVLEDLGCMETWLKSQGRAGLSPCDRLILTPGFARLARDAQSVAALSGDLIGELQENDRAEAQ